MAGNIKQKQRLLGEEVKATQDKLSMLKEADKEVAKEMEAGTEGATQKRYGKNYVIWSDEYARPHD